VGQVPGTQQMVVGQQSCKFAHNLNCEQPDSQPGNMINFTALEQQAGHDHMHHIKIKQGVFNTAGEIQQHRQHYQVAQHLKFHQPEFSKNIHRGQALVAHNIPQIHKQQNTCRNKNPLQHQVMGQPFVGHNRRNQNTDSGSPAQLIEPIKPNTQGSRRNELG